MIDIRNGARESCMTKWQRQWEVSEKGRHLFKFRPNVDAKDKFTEQSKFPSIIRQLRTSYSKLNEYRHKLDPEKSPYCSCGKPESVTHYLEECENYFELRERCRVEMLQKTGTYEFTEETFLNVKTEKDTEENLDKNEILKIISDYIEGTERFTDKSNSN